MTVEKSAATAGRLLEALLGHRRMLAQNPIPGEPKSALNLSIYASNDIPSSRGFGASGFVMLGPLPFALQNWGHLRGVIGSMSLAAGGRLLLRRAMPIAVRHGTPCYKMMSYLSRFYSVPLDRCLFHSRLFLFNSTLLSFLVFYSVPFFAIPKYFAICD